MVPEYRRHRQGLKIKSMITPRFKMQVRCTLVYTGRINNKFLLYSTGNNIQHTVISHNIKEYEKEYICV